MDANEVRDRAAAIADLLQEENQLWRSIRFQYGSPAWYRRLLTHLILLFENDEIAYVSSDIEEDDGFRFTVVVLTTAYLVTASGSGNRESDASIEVSTSVIARTSFSKLDVSGGVGAFGSSDDFGPQWPGRLSVKITTNTGEQITLPLKAIGPNRVAELVPTLMRDVAS